MRLIAIAPALFAAGANALATILQRRVAKEQPSDRTGRLEFIARLVRTPRWLAAIACLVCGFLGQAIALDLGGLALVQPLLATELPVTLVLAAVISGSALDRAGWTAIAALTAGVVVLLIGAAPAPGNRTPDGRLWLIAGAAAGGLIVTAVLAAPREGGGRAAILGVAAGVGFASTAALMKDAVGRIGHGPAALFSCWQLYAMAAAGLCSLTLLQFALRSGPLAFAQPALTISDPIAGIALGVGLYGEHIRLGGWIAMQMAGIALILFGGARLGAVGTQGADETSDDEADAVL